jgi:Ca2+-binding RTX toxin-like protein
VRFEGRLCCPDRRGSFGAVKIEGAKVSSASVHGCDLINGSRLRAIAFAATLAGSLGSVAAAHAATVSFGAGAQATTLRVFATPGEANAIAVTADSTGTTVTDTGGAAPTPGSGCNRVAGSTTAIRCLGPVTALLLSADDMDDTVDNQTSLPSEIYGGDGIDTLTGGSGNDRIVTRGMFTDRVTCGGGDDTVLADPADLIASDCEHVDRGSGMVDTAPATTTPPGTTPAPGAAPSPSSATSSPPDTVVPSLEPGACAVAKRGTRRADLLTGTAGSDLLLGMGGNDRLAGSGGNDCLFGGSGNDVVRGGAGNDFLKGEAGNDRLDGNAGDDGLAGDAGQDVINGGAGDDTMSGGSGGDRMNGGPGADGLNGGAGRDVMSGGPGDDTLLGRAGADRLVGGSGRNRISGGAGDDGIDARGGGVDQISCGSGRDTVRADRGDHVASDCERVKRS